MSHPFDKAAKVAGVEFCLGIPVSKERITKTGKKRVANKEEITLLIEKFQHDLFELLEERQEDARTHAKTCDLFAKSQAELIEANKRIAVLESKMKDIVFRDRLLETDLPEKVRNFLIAGPTS